jgi:metallo-beta-lactamase class B
MRLMFGLMLAATGAHAQGANPAAWGTPTAPFRIVGNVHYVGTKGLAAYLIATPKGAILLDATMTGNAATVERNIRASGFRLSDVKWLIATHEHWDHVGALAEIKRDTGAILLAEAAQKRGLEIGNAVSENDAHPRPFAPVKVDRVLADGATIRLGGVALTPILTPGHTPGCTSWSLRVVDRGRPLNVVFPCSITVAGNRLVGNRTYPGLVADFRKSFARLEAIPADIVLPAHPEAADVLGREAKVKAGQRDAFVEPGLLRKFVGEARVAFDEELRKQQGARR